ncbi:hypothetical protein ACVDG5_005215 [Mesorhizobium sp. ORM6]
MAASGATNVPEGMAWRWRTLSSGAPFTEGRPETEKGNDKVLIVLTDGSEHLLYANVGHGTDLFRRRPAIGVPQLSRLIE